MNLVLSLLLPETIADMPLWAVGISVFVLGTLVGSFLNVVIHRLPQEEPQDRDVVSQPSHCPHCDTPLKPYDNIPLLSYLALGGKCRSCRVPISPRYPAVEALTGALWLALFLHHANAGLSWALAADVILATALVPLIFIDAEHQILPDVITYPLIIFAFLARLALPYLVGVTAFDDLAWFTQRATFAGWPPVAVSLVGAVLGALAGGGLLWLLGAAWEKLKGIEAMGFGDVKLMLGVGAYLGWRMTLLTIFLSALTGSVIGILLMLKRGERDLQQMLPYGIYLGLATIISLLAGLPLLNWYLSTFS